MKSLDPIVVLLLAQTRPSMQLQDLLPNIAPAQLLAYVGRALLVLVLGLVIYRVCVRGLRILNGRGTISVPLMIVLRQLLRWTIAVLTLLVMLQVLDVLRNTWAAFTTILGLVAVGFVAVWSVLSNALCAMLLIVARPFEVGDWVDIPGEPGEIRGKVVDFNLIYTTLRTQDVLVQVPNNIFFQRPLRRKPGEGKITLDEQLLKRGSTDEHEHPGAAA